MAEEADRALSNIDIYAGGLSLRLKNRILVTSSDVVLTDKVSVEATVQISHDDIVTVVTGAEEPPVPLGDWIDEWHRPKTGLSFSLSFKQADIVTLTIIDFVTNTTLVSDEWPKLESWRGQETKCVLSVTDEYPAVQVKVRIFSSVGTFVKDMEIDFRERGPVPAYSGPKDKKIIIYNREATGSIRRPIARLSMLTSLVINEARMSFSQSAQGVSGGGVYKEALCGTGAVFLINTPPASAAAASVVASGAPEWFNLLGEDTQRDIVAMITQADGAYSTSGGVRSAQAIADITTKFEISEAQVIALVDWMRTEGWARSVCCFYL